jgi:arabinose-5-phosphate isomerase
LEKRVENFPIIGKKVGRRILKYTKRAKEIIDIEIAGLKKVRDSINSEFGEAIRVILEKLELGGKIVVTGVGKNLPIGQKIASTLTSTGCPAVFLHPSDAMHGDLGILQKNDVLLALSYSGQSEELLNLIPLVRRIGIPVIALSGEMDSGLAKNSDLVIPVTVDREACPFNMAPTSSTTATLAVGDALAMVLLEARGFEKEDYAKLHPGGTIGRTLLLSVSDIMRTGDRVAKVTKDATVEDAVLAMTSARSGAVAVVDAKDKVLGIFTDGDLRRHITDSTRIGDRLIKDVMTANPITLTRKHLAIDVLTLFEKHNIDDLIIVDEKKHLVGMVDIQDLPKLKIL